MKLDKKLSTSIKKKKNKTVKYFKNNLNLNRQSSLVILISGILLLFLIVSSVLAYDKNLSLKKRVLELNKKNLEFEQNFFQENNDEDKQLNTSDLDAEETPTTNQVLEPATTLEITPDYTTLPISLGYLILCSVEKVEEVKKADNDLMTARTKLINHDIVYYCDSCIDCQADDNDCYANSGTSECYSQRSNCITACNNGPDGNFSSESDGELRLEMMNRYYGCTASCEDDNNACLVVSSKNSAQCKSQAYEKSLEKKELYNQKCEDIKKKSEEEDHKLAIDRDSKRDYLIELIGKYCKKQ